MGRKRHDTSKYGVTASRSIGVQVLGGLAVVIAVMIVLLAINGFTG